MCVRSPRMRSELVNGNERSVKITLSILYGDSGDEGRREDEHMTFNVRDTEIETKLREIGGKIGATLPAQYGFALFLFSHEQEGSNVFYISSDQRDGVISAVREWLNRQVQ